MISGQDNKLIMPVGTFSGRVFPDGPGRMRALSASVLKSAPSRNVRAAPVPGVLRLRGAMPFNDAGRKGNAPRSCGRADLRPDMTGTSSRQGQRHDSSVPASAFSLRAGFCAAPGDKVGPGESALAAQRHVLYGRPAAKRSKPRSCRALAHRSLHRARPTAGDELRPPPSCGTSSSSCARLSRSVFFPPPVPAPPSPAARFPFSDSLRRRGVRRTNVSPASLPSCPSPLFRRASLSFPLRPRLPFCSGPPALLPCASSPSAERSPFPVMLHRPASSRLFRQQGINAWDSFAFFLKKNSGGRIFFSNSVKKTAPCTPSQNQPAIMAYLFPISIAVDGTYHFFLSPNHAS